MTLDLNLNRAWQFLDELEPRQRIAIAVGIPLMIAVAYWFFVVNPRLLRASGQRFLVDELLEERNRKVSETARLNERKRQVDDLDTQLRLAVTRLPDQKEIPDLLSSISNLARDSGLDILAFRAKPETYQDFYAEVPVDMVVRGTFPQLTGFVDDVGRLDRIVNASDITIKEPKVVDEAIILQASLQITTFRFLSDEERQRLIKEKKIKGDAK
ncbi:type 4a pilus biogenesis protein PilO [bacterium]|nr:type 4a pilus biogenesis protein PilO [bacterium]